MYEPSDAIIEQLARETCNALFEQHFINKDYDSLPDENKAEIKKYQVLTYVVNLPTIRKALELYENQPQWQDKPDKTGWWWECYYSKVLSDWISKISPVAINKWADGPTNISIDFEQKEWITIEDYISKSVSKVKFMYASRPEPYKGEE